MTTVAIFGGGIAGLSAAHELAHRGYTVDVYESAPHVGGMAASQAVSGIPPPTGGRKSLLGEHGFRFFPGFYFNLIATMSEIPRPLADGGGSVADDLQPSPQAAMAYPSLNGQPRFYPIDRQLPDPPWDVFGRIQTMLKGLDFTNVDLARMAWFRLKYLTSGPTRRTGEWDAVSWHDFIDLGSPHYSTRFKEFETSIPRTMSAMAAATTSAMIVGNIGMQFGLGYARPGNREDRLLAGPTRHRWLDPWETYLQSIGVAFHFENRLTALDYTAKSMQVSRAKVVDQSGSSVWIKADFYIAALPLGAMITQLNTAPALMADDPELATLGAINTGDATSWMAGVQFFLRQDVPMVAGHVFFPETTWALTSVSQGQFWRPNDTPMEDAYGDGTVRGVISAIVSDWTTPSDFTSRAARDYKQGEEPLLVEEVRRQLQANLPATFDLSAGNIAYAHLDRGIVLTPTGGDNLSKLLIHPLNGYADRPHAHNAIANLFLAADYVRTSVGLATMEGANEAARLAVNALLVRDGGQHLPCPVWTLQEDPTFGPAKQLDEWRWARGMPHVMESCPIRYLNDVGLIDWAQEFFRLDLGKLLSD